ncbi:MAG: two-partner secretion domain-containing protein [Methylobacter sp.]
MSPISLLAAPTDGVVVSGDATIGQTGAVTTITQSTPKAAINWQGFSIGSGETVNFQQPDAHSITLNRVLGNERSVIEGALNANGQIFLINSNGVLFNQGSSVNVGGLVASTLDISDEDFEAGRYVFQGNDGSGSVINMGSLSAADQGYVALLGKKAINQGVISATLGTAALGAGERITLNFNGDSLLSVSIDQGMLNALVDNQEAIHADGGKVFLTARAVDAVLGSQVNNSGVVEARTLNDLKGEIVVQAHGGTVNIDGALDASAPNSGDGGSIETSGGKVKIADSAVVTARSETGATGQWQINSQDYTIADSGGDMSGTFLSNQLDSDKTKLTINSVQGGSSAGDINVKDTVSWSSNAKLTLQATNDLNVNKAITAGGDSSGVTLTAGQNVNINDAIALSGDHATLAIQATAGNVNVNAAITAGGDAAGLTLTAGRDVNVKSGITLSGDHAALAMQAANDVNVNEAIAADGDAAGVTLTAGNNVNVNNAVNWSSNARLALQATNDVNVNKAISVGGDSSGVTLTAGKNVNINDAVTLSGNHATMAMNYGGDYNILTPASFSGTVLDSNGKPVAKQDTSGGVYGSVTLSGSNSGLKLNNQSYTLIRGMDDFAAISGVTGKYALVTNLDATDWSSAHTGAMAVVDLFSGVLTGLGHTVSNLTLRASVPDSLGPYNGAWGGIGFIGTAINPSATARDIGIVNADISRVDTNSRGISGASILAGIFSGQLAGFTGNISNAYSTGKISLKGPVGGLVGSFKGTMTNAFSNADISAGSGGGLVGGVNGVLKNVHATGKITLNDAYQGITVSGLSGTGGLAGSVNGSIYNAYALNSLIGGNSSTGLGGLVAGMAGSSANPITVKDSFATGDVTGGAQLGGLIGSMVVSGSTETAVTIQNVYATGKVTANYPQTDAVAQGVGGLIGYANLGTNAGILTMDRAYATGDIVLSPAYGSFGYVGGLIGFLATKAGTIKNSYETGNVYAPGVGGNYVGGLIGIAQSRGRDNYAINISDSYATGDVTGNSVVGGLVGSFSSAFATTRFATPSGTISDSYASGTVTGNSKVGGVIGLSSQTNVNSDVYYNANCTSTTGGACVLPANGNPSNWTTPPGQMGGNPLTGPQVADMPFYVNKTIDKVLADRAAADAAAQVAADAAAKAAADAAAKAAADAAAKAAADAAAKTAADAAAQAAAQAVAQQAATQAAEVAVARTVSQVASTRVADVQRQNGSGSSAAAGILAGANTVSAPAPSSIDNNIVSIEPDSYSAHVQRIEVDGVVYNLDEEGKTEGAKTE